MTIQLHSLIYLVREGLSELPADLASDEQIYNDLKLASNYIDSIIRDDFDNEKLLQDAIVTLAMYFTYNNYCTLAERDFGNVPVAAMSRDKMLKHVALAFIRQLTDLPIKDDLSINEDSMNRAGWASIGLVNNVWEQ